MIEFLKNGLMIQIKLISFVHVTNDIFLEVEELLKKELLYKEIDTLLHNLSSIHVSHKRNLQFPDLCIAFERDKAISSLRFLYMFYDLPPEVFFLSTTLFDSILDSNQVLFLFIQFFY